MDVFCFFVKDMIFLNANFFFYNRPMKKLFLSLSLLIFNAWTSAQVNMNLLSNLNYQTLHATELSDIWGYVDELGNEYALVGGNDGISIVNVTNPSSPTEVYWLPGMNSVWRDLKCWGDYLYVTTEAQQGLTIIDLSPLPQSNVLTHVFYTGPSGGATEWESAHNLFIDSSGYAYIFGANRGNGGVIMLDVHTNPMAPIEVGVFDTWYAHDGYVRNNILYGAHISDGHFSVVDVTNKANPVLLGVKPTTNFFTHNIWESDDAKHVFTTDEVSGAFLGAYNVEDPSNMYETDRIQSSPGSGVIPHNVHVKGDFLVTSYYRDGVTVHDISRPNNLVEVGRFDTSPFSGGGFNGCWGTYPFLPSGNVLATDIEQGLFVLGTNYVKGCYVEGVVTDSITNLPLPGVTVTIINEVQTDQSDAAGNYAVSTVSSGTKTVKYNKQGYAQKTLTFNLVNGLLINQNVQLVPLPPFNFTLKVIDQATNLPINNVQIRLENPEIIHEGQTNGLGEEDFVLYYQNVYAITVGKWGYITHCESTVINNSTGTITISLKKGIYDDFSFDFGWNSTGTATTGLWERGIPFGGNMTSNPNKDADYDCGRYAYVTGNEATLDGDADDVDNGTAILVSPGFDLTTYSDPYINYSRYFYNNFGPFAVDDTLRIILSNGSTAVLLDKVGQDTAIYHKWIFKSIRVADYLTPTANMTLIIRTSDLDSNINITEAGFDFFSVSNSPLVSLDETEPAIFEVFPNPVINQLQLSGLLEGENLVIYDTKGALMHNSRVQQTAMLLDMSHLKPGMYFVHHGGQQKKFIKN